MREKKRIQLTGRAILSKGDAYADCPSLQRLIPWAADEGRLKSKRLNYSIIPAVSYLY